MRTAQGLVLWACLASCGGQDGTAPAAVDRGEPPALTPPAPAIRRLTTAQYTNAVHDALGATLVVPTNLEPDTEVGGLFSVGMSVATISPLGVEQYETAAYDLADQVLADPALRSGVIPCTAAGVRDDACARQGLAPVGRRLWRRALTAEELDLAVDLAGDAADALGDFDGGYAYALAWLLQSPNFLFRVELGEPDPERPGGFRYSDDELATRLAFLLWNTTPDDALLDAAANHELTTEAGLETQLDRMLQDERLHVGVRSFFDEMLALHDLDAVTKDPTIFTHWSSDVQAAAQEETLLGIEDLVFAQNADIRDLLTQEATWVDRSLAAVYNVQAPVHEGFGRISLDEAGGRRGLFGQVSFLALEAHPVSTSITRRGKFVREKLLCQAMPPPPAGVDTSIPEPTEEAPTMRDLVAQHLADPVCASCHQLTDPIGLGFERFDGIGRWRDEDNGIPIDASGDLDGTAFDSAWDLARVVHDDPHTGPCFARTVYRYAVGHEVADGEEDLVDWHASGFEASGYRFAALLRDIALSPGFRTVGGVE